MNNYINTFFKAVILLFCTFLNLRVAAQEVRAKPDKEIKIGFTTKNVVLKIGSRAKILRRPDQLLQDSIIHATGNSIVVSVNTPRNVVVDIEDSRVKTIKFLLAQVDTIRINGNLNETISIYKYNTEKLFFGDINAVEINNASLEVVNFQNLCLNSLVFRKSKLLFLNLKDAVVKNTFLMGQVRLDSANFFNTELPAYITLDSVDIKPDGLIDLSKLRHINRNSACIYF